MMENRNRCILKLSALGFAKLEITWLILVSCLWPPWCLVLHSVSPLQVHWPPDEVIHLPGCLPHLFPLYFPRRETRGSPNMESKNRDSLLPWKWIPLGNRWLHWSTDRLCGRRRGWWMWGVCTYSLTLGCSAFILVTKTHAVDGESSYWWSLWQWWDMLRMPASKCRGLEKLGMWVVSDREQGALGTALVAKTHTCLLHPLASPKNKCCFNAFQGNPASGFSNPVA